MRGARRRSWSVASGKAGTGGGRGGAAAAQSGALHRTGVEQGVRAPGRGAAQGRVSRQGTEGRGRLRKSASVSARVFARGSDSVTSTYVRRRAFSSSGKEVTSMERRKSWTPMSAGVNIRL